MAMYSIWVLDYAAVEKFPQSVMLYGPQYYGIRNLPYAYVLIKGQGEVILVDTGYDHNEDGKYLADLYGVSNWHSAAEVLAECGVAPADVTTVLITHAHFDHMGSIDKFPNARLHLQKREMLSWIEAMALPPQFGFLTEIINPENLRSAFDASVEHRLNLVDGDVDNLLPGIHVRLGEGHTLGQQFVVIESAKGKLVISGDCIYARRNICGHNHNGVYVPLGNGIGSVWEQLKTIDRINREISGDMDRLIILHDSDRWKGLPVVHEIDGFRILLAS